ncbi:hypothetical protein RRG08_066276 [Elysia crispata]|uniref:Uncharacterized protein n=1 Tax=Elysia crispata TaxID=231223 RepID=A0AAE1B8S2_9GAST|nr:hypothetical protein RRG08_066276 [Elysia crispata]
MNTECHEFYNLKNTHPLKNPCLFSSGSALANGYSFGLTLLSRSESKGFLLPPGFEFINAPPNPCKNTCHSLCPRFVREDALLLMPERNVGHSSLHSKTSLLSPIGKCLPLRVGGRGLGQFFNNRGSSTPEGP